MHSQSCSFLLNKKQSTFNSSLPNNIEIFRNFSSNTLIPTFKDLNISQHTSRSASVMNFVYSFSDSSKIKIREPLSKGAIPTEKSSHSCKQLISHYNTVTQMPFVSSHLVGGFVGSKSQLGRRPTHGFGVNMWDIIRELIGVFGSSSANIVKKGNNRKSTFISKKFPSMEKVNSQETLKNKNSNSMNNGNTKLKDTHNSQKQSYADVAKIKLEIPLTEELPTASVFIQENSQRDCSSALEHISMCSESDNRHRILSECSIDSEDSFIVFEYCEEDDISIVDGDYSTSDDDDSVMDIQIENKESCTDIDNASIKICDSTNDHKLSRKKVQFAEEKDLVEVHPMVTWDYAYRAARRGPWEMLARDSARFRCRIANTEAILSPILDPAYREAVFQQRFASSCNCT